MKGALYVKGQNLRQELTYESKARKLEHQNVIILNADKKTMWMLMPARKSYMVQPLSATEFANMAAGMRGQLATGKSKDDPKIKKLGTETVSGYLCEKLQAENQRTTITVWYSKKLELSLRTEMSSTEGGRKTTYRQEVKNIKARKLDTSLFSPPKGYKPMKMPKGPAGMPKHGEKKGRS